MKAKKIRFIAIFLLIFTMTASVAFAADDGSFKQDSSLVPTNVSEFFERVRSENSLVQEQRSSKTKNNEEKTVAPIKDPTDTKLINISTSDTENSKKEKGRNTIVATSTERGATLTASTTTDVIGSTSDTPNPQVKGIALEGGTFFANVFTDLMPANVYEVGRFSRLTTFSLIGFAIACGLVGIIFASGKLVHPTFPMLPSHRFSNRRIVTKN